MPGRSWITISLLVFHFPSFFSTVTPGQFPTYWLLPVRSLNMVVLPQLGLPAKAILMDMAIFLPVNLIFLCVNYD